MNILAIDQAKETGWASLADSCIFSGVQTFDLKRGETAGMRYLRFGAWLLEMLKIMKTIDLIVYEAPTHRGGAPTEAAYGYITKIKEFAAVHHCELASINISTLKKWATGHGKASKADMVKAVNEKGFKSVDNDNEADAIHLLLKIMEELNVDTEKPKSKLVRRQ